MILRYLAMALTLFCTVPASFFLRACREKRYRRAFWLKGAAGLCFLLPGLLLSTICRDGGYAWLIVAGLCLGLLGDQLLALRFLRPAQHDQMFLLGAIAFALGHVLYVLALWRLSGWSGWVLAIWAAGLALSGFYARRRKVDAGKFQTAAIAYIALVVLMAAVACAAALREKTLAMLLFALGGVCFAVSDDLLVAYSYGDAEGQGFNRAIHITYYTAQLCIAWTLFFL